MDLRSVTAILAPCRYLVVCILVWGCSKDVSHLYTFHHPIGKAPLVLGTDHTGSEFRSDTLAGKVWLASFFFTSCPDVCPTMNRAIADIVRKFPGDALRIVSISADPDYDTPEVMAEYAQEFTHGDKRWAFVNVPYDSMLTLARRGFILQAPEEPLMHSSRVILVDEDYQIRDYFSLIDSSDVKRLTTILNEKGI